MNKHLISVIVVNWNGKHIIGDCLESLRQQTFKDFETIVVDNGSKDGSIEFLKEKYPEALLVPLEKNLGFAGGNNKGFEHSKGEFIALLNNDAVADIHWLKELYQDMAFSADIGICASKILLSDSKGLIDSAGDGLGVCGVGYKKGHRTKNANFEKKEQIFGACGAAVLYRRSMLEDIGFFDDDLFCVHEDVDLSFRANLKGYKCLFVPTALVHHKCNSSLGRFSDNYVYYGHRNAEIVYLKNMPGKLIVRYLHHHILYNVLSFIYFLFHGKGRAFIKAKWDFFRMLPIIMEKRKRIQSSRVIGLEQLESLMEKKWLRARTKH